MLLGMEAQPLVASWAFRVRIPRDVLVLRLPASAAGFQEVPGEVSSDSSDEKMLVHLETASNPKQGFRSLHLVTKQSLHGCDS